MEALCDFHIHTALSPCGDNDMTPNNIVNMAKLKGLDVIAITDHNSCENTAVCIEVGKRSGLTVIPGMELQTREDIHVVCLFENMENVLQMQKFVYSHLPAVKNNPQIFGEQLILNDQDEVVGIIDKMLLNSTDISIDEAFKIVSQLNGAFIPAHIDKESFGLLSSIGFVPDYLDVKTLEYFSFSKINNLIKVGILSEKYRYIRSSDAHYLYQIPEKEEAVRIKLNNNEINIRSVLDYLNSGVECK